MAKRLAKISQRLLDSAMAAGRERDEREITARDFNLGKNTLVEPGIIKLRNGTGSNLDRGSVLHVSAEELSQKRRFHPWFSGFGVTAADALPAVYLEPCPSGKIAPAKVLGVCIVRVDVLDTGHQYAVASNGDSFLTSGVTGTVRMLGTLTATGEQEVWCLLSPTITEREQRITVVNSFGGDLTAFDDVIHLEEPDAAFLDWDYGNTGLSGTTDYDIVQISSKNAIEVNNPGVHQISFHAECDYQDAGAPTYGLQALRLQALLKNTDESIAYQSFTYVGHGFSFDSGVTGGPATMHAGISFVIPVEVDTAGMYIQVRNQTDYAIYIHQAVMTVERVGGLPDQDYFPGT